MDDFNPEDVNVIQTLANSPVLDDLTDALEDDEAYVEMAWLAARAEELEQQWRVSQAIAVATAYGLITGFALTVPERKDEEDAAD